MIRKNFTVESDYDGLKLQGIVYEPDGQPKGIVQLVHGMGEYKNYYEHVMKFFASKGYIAAGYDHRGHGESVLREEDLGWFGDGSGKAIVEDCAKVTRYLRSEYPNLSLTLYGHSMGSMVVRCYLREHDDLIDKLIVCGSPSYNPFTPSAFLLQKFITLCKGERYRSKMLDALSIGKGAEKLKKEKGGSWLTRDEEVVAKKDADPRCGFIFTCNGFENLLNLMKYTYRKKGYQVKNPSLTIHFVAGSDDIMIGDELKWFKAIEFLRGVGYENVSGKLYEGMRHEIHNEIGKEEVFEDLLRFIEG